MYCLFCCSISPSAALIYRFIACLHLLLHLSSLLEFCTMKRPPPSISSFLAVINTQICYPSRHTCIAPFFLSLKMPVHPLLDGFIYCRLEEQAVRSSHVHFSIHQALGDRRRRAHSSPHHIHHGYERPFRVRPQPHESLPFYTPRPSSTHLPISSNLHQHSFSTNNTTTTASTTAITSVIRNRITTIPTSRLDLTITSAYSIYRQDVCSSRRPWRGQHGSTSRS